MSEYTTAINTSWAAASGAVPASKWSAASGTQNTSNSSTPTAPSTTLATGFPSFGGIPPLYHSVSAQSSNSAHGGGLSPFAAQNPAASAYPFTATPSGSQAAIAAAGAAVTPTAATTAHKAQSGGAGAATTRCLSASSSSNSLTALTNPMHKLSINAAALSQCTTPYNPYNGGFTPYGATTPTPYGATTPTGHSQQNTPNPQGATPTAQSQFRFNGYAANPYSGITPTASATTPNAMWKVTTPNALQQTAAINNLNAMHSAYPLYPPLATLPGLHSQAPHPMAIPSKMVSPPAHSSHTAHPHGQQLGGHKNTASRLNSDARPYQPGSAGPAAAPPPVAKEPQRRPAQPLSHRKEYGHQSQHQSAYPSYAEAVNKEAALQQQDAVNALRAAMKDSKMSAESSEAIQKLNPLTWPCSPRHAKFYVIKSFGEDDVHKSIKYNLWCSTERGNRKLDEAFNESKRINSQRNGKEGGGGDGDKNANEIDARDTTMGCPVYLFYSVNRSGCFCGMAQMISNYYADRHFGSWVQDGKWQGSFIVKWIYVKDIPNKDLKDIQLPNNDGRPVTFSRDTQEIPFKQGIEMLTRFIKYEPKTNILQDFKYYDDRERDIKMKRTEQMVLQSLPSGPPPQHGQPQGVAMNGIPPSGATVNGHRREHGAIENMNGAVGGGPKPAAYHSPGRGRKPFRGGYRGGARGGYHQHSGQREGSYRGGRGNRRRYFEKSGHSVYSARGQRGGRRGKYGGGGGGGQNRFSSPQSGPVVGGGGGQYGDFQILKRGVSAQGMDSAQSEATKEEQAESADNEQVGGGSPGRRYGGRPHRNRWVPK